MKSEIQFNLLYNDIDNQTEMDFKPILHSLKISGDRTMFQHVGISPYWEGKTNVWIGTDRQRDDGHKCCSKIDQLYNLDFANDFSQGYG